MLTQFGVFFTKITIRAQISRVSKLLTVSGWRFKRAEVIILFSLHVLLSICLRLK